MNRIMNNIVTTSTIKYTYTLMFWLSVLLVHALQKKEQAKPSSDKSAKANLRATGANLALKAEQESLRELQELPESSRDPKRAPESCQKSPKSSQDSHDQTPRLFKCLEKLSTELQKLRLDAIWGIYGAQNAPRMSSRGPKRSSETWKRQPIRAPRAENTNLQKTLKTHTQMFFHRFWTSQTQR